MSIMARMFGNLAHSIVAWASVADYRHREACRMMELDGYLLDDLGVTREEMLAVLGVRKIRGTGRRRSIKLSRHAVSNEF